MQFENVLGHTEIKSHLIETVRNNRVSHSQLFFGPEGNGALPLAIAYAQYILCENPTENDSCGVCVSCKQVSSFNYPDLHFVYPIAKTQSVSSKPLSIEFISQWKELVQGEKYFGLFRWLENLGVENKQAFISVAETENMLRQLSLKSYSGKSKILILWMPERLNGAAANKILKLLEEPPKQTVFLLVSEDPDAIIKTITSRSQKIFIPKYSDSYTTQFLIENDSLEEGTASVIAKLADGNLATARKLAERAETYRDYAMLFSSWVRNCYAAKLKPMLEWAEECGRFEREKLKDFISFCGNTFRDSLHIYFGSEEDHNVVFKDINFELSNFSRFIHLKNTPKILDELDKASYDIGRNANAKIVLADLSMNVARLLRTPG